MVVLPTRGSDYIRGYCSYYGSGYYFIYIYTLYSISPLFSIYFLNDNISVVFAVVVGVVVVTVSDIF